MSDTGNPEPITVVIGALKPLTSAERQRTVRAALLYLDEKLPVNEGNEGNEGNEVAKSKDTDDENETLPRASLKWLKQNDVPLDKVDEYFELRSDGTFDILNAPGKSMKEKTVAIYFLTALGNHLSRQEQNFEDSLARVFCQELGCYDSPNHSSYLKSLHPTDIRGDKKKGFRITRQGLSKAANLIKSGALIQE